jgi:hypothetical protein
MATQLGRCLCISLYCAQICAATGHALSVDTGSYTHIVRAVLEACEAACKASLMSADATPQFTNTAESALKFAGAVNTSAPSCG